MRHCFHCKNRLKISAKPPRDAVCSGCGYDLKTCLNCRLYEVNSLNQCREPMAERVYDKERANFCEYFHFKESIPLSISNRQDPLEGLKRLFNEA